MRISIWEKSPPDPSLRKKIVTQNNKKEEDQKHRKSSKNSKRSRRRSPSPSSSSSSDSSSSSSSDSSTSSSSTSSSYRNRKSQKRSKVSDEIVEKSLLPLSSNNEPSNPIFSNTAFEELNQYEKAEALDFQREVQGNKLLNNDNESDDEFGPRPMSQMHDPSLKVNYGKALLPGEGAAIAQYVQQNMRIPRRGEIGWKADEIEGLESQGYVMSGSRHKRMNAVRLRKENQVYSAEEKKALAMINFEENMQKESKVIGEFRKILSDKLND